MCRTEDGLGPIVDFDQKVLQTAWHPSAPLVAVASVGSFYLYGLMSTGSVAAC